MLEDKTRGSFHPWPGLLDLVTSALMVFLLVGFVQTVMDVQSLEMLLVRQQQIEFSKVFEAEFKSELDAETIRLDHDLSFLQITFSEGVLFDSGQHRLKLTGRKLLTRCAQVFAEIGGARGFEQVQVEGHTDDVPLRGSDYPHDNWELSTARALSVVKFLSTQGGLPPEVLSANGYSEYRPVASNHSGDGRSRNRRIEIRVFFTAEEG